MTLILADFCPSTTADPLGELEMGARTNEKRGSPALPLMFPLPAPKRWPEPLLQIEAVEVHHLVPGRNNEVMHELRRIAVVLRIDLRARSELEPKIRSTRVPVHLLARLAVAPFEGVAGLPTWATTPAPMSSG